MTTAVASYNQDENIRAILFTGNGEAFSAGADLGYLKQLRSNSLEDNIQDSRKLAELFELIYQSPKLTFSAVDGFALAGGCGLAILTDFCYATEKARFGFTEVKIGFIPAIVSNYLRQKIKGSDLNRLLLTAEIIDAKEAKNIGIVSGILDFETFYDQVHSLIQNLLKSTSDDAIAGTKALLRETYALPHQSAIDKSVEANAHARASSDCIRGVDAFLNKERINW